MLLSHTSSVREHDDNYVLPLGASLEAAMQDPREWDRAHGPGDHYFAYTNMNFPIVASVVERVTGERFDQWMRTHVLEPMKLDACYNWRTCSDAEVARAVELDAPDGKPLKDDLHGRRPACPIYRQRRRCLRPRALEDRRQRLALFAAGRASHLGARPRPGRPHAPQPGHARRRAHPLAAIGRDDAGAGMALRRPQRRARRRECDRLLLRPLGAADPQPPAAPTTRARTERSLVGHAGDAYGLRSGLWIDRKRGVGIAYFVTGVPEDPPEKSVFSPAETAAFRRTYALLPH